MKKYSLLLFSVVAVAGLLFMGFRNYHNGPENYQPSQDFPPFLKTEINAEPDFIYNIDVRFNTTRTKSQLREATTVLDIFPEEATASLNNYGKTLVAAIQYPEDVKKYGSSETLTQEQLDLLQSLDYSADFYLNSDCLLRDEWGNWDHKIVYYMTVVPEQEAEYVEGEEALIQYLKTESQEEVDKILGTFYNPGRIRFTVTKEGNIDEVKLTAETGHIDLDNTMKTLIEEMPGKWKPARNDQGVAVGQELVFFFGKQGC